MNDKVTNFLEATKEIDDPVLPIEKDAILKLLQNVPEDIFDSYLEVFENHIENLLVVKNVLAARNHLSTFDRLTEGVTPKQFNRLNRIALNLAVDEPLEKINELVEATVGLVIPSEESCCKAVTLLEQIKAFGIDYKDKSRELALLSAGIRLMAETLAVLNLGSIYEHIMIDRLSQIPEEEFERLIEISNSLIIKNLN